MIRQELLVGNMVEIYHYKKEHEAVKLLRADESVYECSNTAVWWTMLSRGSYSTKISQHVIEMSLCLSH